MILHIVKSFDDGKTASEWREVDVVIKDQGGVIQFQDRNGFQGSVLPGAEASLGGENSSQHWNLT